MTSAACTTSLVSGFGYGEGDAPLSEDLHSHWIDLVGGPGAGGPHVHLARREVVREGGCHLGAASVLNTDEEQLGNWFDQAPISLGGSGELLPREPGDK